MCVSASVRVCVLVLVTCAAAYDQPYDILYSPVERGALDDCYNATTRLPQVRTKPTDYDQELLFAYL